LRLIDEKQKFDPERYICDTMEPDAVDAVLQFEGHWDVELKRQKAGVEEFKFEEEEKEAMRKLPNKRHLVDDVAMTMLSLVDLIFAYAYNARTTYGENTCESAWTMWKLSSTLSWFEEFKSMDYMLHTAAKRSLTFPLYRNWKLVEAVMQDVINIFQAGRSTILRCLLQIKYAFDHEEMKYLFSILYVNDYCVWIQRISDSALQQCLEALKAVKLDKTKLGLPYDLDEIIDECIPPEY